MLNKEQVNTLKELYNNVVKIYIDQFCEKHEIDFDSWIGDNVGEIACIGDYYFNFSDIKFDIDNNVPEKYIFNWYNIVLELHEQNKDILNFKSYCKGAPIPR